MKKIFLLLIALLAFSALNATSFTQELAAVMAPASGKYLIKTKGFRPSSELAKEPSLWKEFTALFTSEKEEAMQQVLADYLYNMYIIDAAKGSDLHGAFIDTSYIGALDPIYRSTFKNGKEIKDFYYGNMPQINKNLTNNFKELANLDYNPSIKENSRTQGIYINMLVNTYNKNGKLSYMPGQGGIAPTMLSDARISQLKKQITENNNKNRDLSVIYEYTDAMQMLDNATRVSPSKGSSKKYTFRPLSQECAACSYSFCKDICIAAENKYGQYKILRVYNLRAYPRIGFLKDSKGNDRFIAPDGQTYPQWDYHAASLLVFEEDGGLNFTVVDTLLAAEPQPLSQWIATFDKSDTLFYIAPFIRDGNNERRIWKTSDLPASYTPHKIRE